MAWDLNSALHVIKRKYIISCHDHCTVIVSRGWANASTCSFQIYLSCAILHQLVSIQYSSLHRLAGLTLDCFPSYGDMRFLSVISYSTEVPIPGPLPASDLLNHIFLRSNVATSVKLHQHVINSIDVSTNANYFLQHTRERPQYIQCKADWGWLYHWLC